MMSLVLMFLLIVLDSVVPFVPGEAALLAAAATALTVGWPALIAVGALAAVAAFVGDNLTYELGRRLGTTRFRWMRHPRVAGLLARTGDRLEQRGVGVIATARLVPGLRVAITFAAGATHMSRGKFRVASALGALLWVAYLLTVGSTIGAITGGSTLVVVVLSIVTMAVINVVARRLRRRFAGVLSRAQRAVRTTILPVLAPRIMSRKAWGAFSMPPTTVSS